MTSRPGGVGGSVILTRGSKGQLVRDVQTALGNLRVDGIYGQETVNKSRSFQASKGLLVDGTWDPKLEHSGYLKVMRNFINKPPLKNLLF